MPPLKNRIGDKYGRLMVIKRAPNKGEHVCWTCQCDCGNFIDVLGNSLQSGNTRSCGCLNNESRQQIGHNNKIDLTGKRFGHLLVLKDTQQTKRIGKNGYIHFYECQCDYGAIVIFIDSNLRSGNTQSCGCIRMSQSEKTIASILKENYINFSIEYVVNIQGKNCRYDFCIKDKENNPIYFIEADGEHHFYAQDSGTRYTLADFEITQEHDKIKNQWCKDNHYPLIRIPYTHFKDIELKDLLLETSTYLI